MFTTQDLTEARAVLADLGGWLLDFGDSVYAVTEDEEIVRDLRGNDFLARCRLAACWDETQVEAE